MSANAHAHQSLPLLLLLPSDSGQPRNANPVPDLLRTCVYVMCVCVYVRVCMRVRVCVCLYRCLLMHMLIDLTDLKTTSLHDGVLLLPVMFARCWCMCGCVRTYTQAVDENLVSDSLCMYVCVCVCVCMCVCVRTQAVDENLVSDWLRAPHPDWNSPVSSVDELPSQHDHAPGDCTGTNAKGGCEVRCRFAYAV